MFCGHLMTQCLLMLILPMSQQLMTSKLGLKPAQCDNRNWRFYPRSEYDMNLDENALVVMNSEETDRGNETEANVLSEMQATKDRRQSDEREINLFFQSHAINILHWKQHCEA